MSARRKLTAARSERRAGFTLLEVLVASAVTALIVAALFGLVVTLLAHWSRTQGRLGAEAQAQVVLDYLAQDLQGALLPEPGRLGLAATVENDNGPSGAWVAAANPKPAAASLAPSVDDLRSARFGRAGVWLRFFTHRLGSSADGSNVANPVAVSYQIIRRPLTAGGTNNRYFLYRGEVTASATLDAGLDLNGAGYGEASPASGVAGNVISPVPQQVIAENVIDFGVRFSRLRQDPATGRLELRRLFSQSDDDGGYSTAEPLGAAPRLFPEVVEVMVRILTDDGARQIAALEANAVGGDWWGVAEAHSHVFTRRILLPAEDN